MASGDASVQPVQFSQQERVLLLTQSRFDRRSIPLTWYWRLIRDVDGVVGGTAQGDDYGEAPRTHRRYAAPIAVHLFIDDSNKRKWNPKGAGNETTDPEAKIGFSRAEARRLGAILGTHDVKEGLVKQPEGDAIFIPRAEDVFLVRGEYFYEVAKVQEERLGLTPIVVLWKGTSHMLRGDSSRPTVTLFPAPPTKLPVPEAASWRG